MGALQLRMRAMFENGESTEFSGLCLRHFAADPNRLSKTGKVWTTGDLGYEYGLQDIDGRVIGSVRQVKSLLEISGHTWVSALTPQWLRIPGWLISAMNSKL